VLNQTFYFGIVSIWGEQEKMELARKIYIKNCIKTVYNLDSSWTSIHPPWFHFSNTDRMTEVVAPDIYRARWFKQTNHKTSAHVNPFRHKLSC
jgi:hypothetical protein